MSPVPIESIRAPSKPVVQPLAFVLPLRTQSYSTRTSNLPTQVRRHSIALRILLLPHIAFHIIIARVVGLVDILLLVRPTKSLEVTSLCRTAGQESSLASCKRGRRHLLLLERGALTGRFHPSLQAWRSDLHLRPRVSRGCHPRPRQRSRFSRCCRGICRRLLCRRLIRLLEDERSVS